MLLGLAKISTRGSLEAFQQGRIDRQAGAGGHQNQSSHAAGVRQGGQLRHRAAKGMTDQYERAWLDGQDGCGVHV